MAQLTNEFLLQHTTHKYFPGPSFLPENEFPTRMRLVHYLLTMTHLIHSDLSRRMPLIVHLHNVVRTWLLAQYV
jgi:hypothetical protein